MVGAASEGEGLILLSVDYEKQTKHYHEQINVNVMSSLCALGLIDSYGRSCEMIYDKKYILMD